MSAERDAEIWVLLEAALRRLTEEQR